jgi:hypothetical protein
MPDTRVAEGGLPCLKEGVPMRSALLKPRAVVVPLLLLSIQACVAEDLAVEDGEITPTDGGYAMAEPESDLLAVSGATATHLLSSVNTGDEPSSVVIGPDGKTAFAANRGFAANGGFRNSNLVNALTTICNVRPIEVSTQSAVGVFFPDLSRRPKVGETFALHVFAGDVSTCGGNAVRPSLKLPAGVELVPSSAGQKRVRCFRYDSAHPSNLTDFTSNPACPQNPTSQNGFLNLSPVGAAANQGWGLKQAVDPAENLIEIQLIVRATSSGSKTVQARLCDLNSAASGVPCAGSPGSNVNTFSFQFTVDPA